MTGVERFSKHPARYLSKSSEKIRGSRYWSSFNIYVYYYYYSKERLCSKKKVEKELKESINIYNL